MFDYCNMAQNTRESLTLILDFFLKTATKQKSNIVTICVLISYIFLYIWLLKGQAQPQSVSVNVREISKALSIFSNSTEFSLASILEHHPPKVICITVPAANPSQILQLCSNEHSVPLYIKFIQY